MRCTPGDFHCDTISQEVTAVHFVTGVIGISVIVELHETESILLQGYFTNSSKFPEKSFDILFSGAMVKSSDIDTS